jgi:signal transduction histidine kinase
MEPTQLQDAGEEGGCTQCQAAHEKPKAGNHPCSKRPRDLAPVIGGAMGAIVVGAIVVVVIAVLQARHVRLRREAERDFLAITSHEVRNPLNGTTGWLKASLASRGEDITPMLDDALACTMQALT